MFLSLDSICPYSVKKEKSISLSRDESVSVNVQVRFHFPQMHFFQDDHTFLWNQY